MLNLTLNKVAGSEDAGLSDPRTNLPIRVTTTVRMKYREYFNQSWADKSGRDLYEDLRNSELNSIIAQDFAASQGGVVHLFVSKSSDISSKRRSWVEIRKVSGHRPFNVFFSIIRPDAIDIIGVSTRYFKPRKPRVFVPK